MDARTLLQSVAEAYRNLKSLAAGGLSITESHDDGLSRNEQPVTFSYTAPDHARLQQGKRGVILVSNGEVVHTYFQGPKRYSSSPLVPPRSVPGMFNPEFPHSQNSSFLFQRIAERVAGAEVLRSEVMTIDGVESPCDVVSVAYEPSPSKFITAMSPLLFWIEKARRLVLRMESEMTIQTPRSDAHTARNMVVLTRLAVDQPIDASTFEFTPPADAEALPGGGGGRLGGFGRGGFSQSGRDKQRISHETSYDRDGNTYIERSRWMFHGHEINFERRWTLSEDKTEIRIAERIQGPKEPIERAISIPVA